MEYNILGKTNLKVSKLCFGTLSIGPLQGNLSVYEGVKVIGEAIEQGINFFDTAELYKSYKYLKEAIKEYGRHNFVIVTKSYAYDEQTAMESLDKALTELGTDYIDSFSLHEQESEHTLRGHREALDYFCKMKNEGVLKSVGLSTHHVAGVLAGAELDEIDVIHPILNIKGLGVQDGTREDMEKAIEIAYNKGIGIYAMKALGGGNLLNISDQCFDYILNYKHLHSIAIGMKTIEEVKYNAMLFNNVEIPNEIKEKVSNTNRELLIDFWCEGCGECVKHCSHDALKMENDKVVVDKNKCVTCGYCSAYCPQFCIKII